MLAEVAAKLKAGEWVFWVPSLAIDVARRSLEAAGWNVRMVQGGSRVSVQVSPRTKLQNELVAAAEELRAMWAKEKN